MRLTEEQKRQVLDSCRVTRPGASLIRVHGQWAALWYVFRDNLLGDVKVPCAYRWRTQLLVEVTPTAVWWSGYEHQHGTRRAAVEAVKHEALEN